MFLIYFISFSAPIVTLVFSRKIQLQGTATRTRARSLSKEESWTPIYLIGSGYSAEAVEDRTKARSIAGQNLDPRPTRNDLESSGLCSGRSTTTPTADLWKKSWPKVSEKCQLGTITTFRMIGPWKVAGNGRGSGCPRPKVQTRASLLRPPIHVCQIQQRNRKKTLASTVWILPRRYLFLLPQRPNLLQPRQVFRQQVFPPPLHPQQQTVHSPVISPLLSVNQIHPVAAGRLAKLVPPQAKNLQLPHGIKAKRLLVLIFDT